MLDLCRAIGLACVPRLEIIFIATATGIIEWHALVLRLIEEPTGLLLTAVPLRPGQQATIFRSFTLQTLLVTGDLCSEVVVVSFAAAIFELLAGLGVRVVEPSREVPLAGAYFLLLLARIKIIGNNAKLLALFSGLELVRISETAAINELTTPFPVGVIVPRREVAFARSWYLW